MTVDGLGGACDCGVGRNGEGARRREDYNELQYDQNYCK
jgi:hypothetical protein